MQRRYLRPFLIPALVLCTSVLFIIRLGSLPPVPASAQGPGTTILDVGAMQDSWVYESEPTSTFGDDPLLQVGRGAEQPGQNPGRANILVQFDLSGLPQGSTVVSASLVLSQQSFAGDRAPIPFSSLAILAPWDDDKVTWNNRPDAKSYNDPPLEVDFSNRLRRWDVTNIVTEWASNQLPNHGIMLRGGPDITAIRRFTSIDDPTGAPGPRLLVEYIAPTPTATATNTRTATATSTRTNTPTATPTNTPTNTPTATSTRRPTNTATSTRTATRTPTATRTTVPTWTPIPSFTPTTGPSPTATPLLVALPYFPPGPIDVAPFLRPDLAIHGIEITQGIQCYDTSNGLAACANNSLPVVTKKDTTARIYLDYNGILFGYNNAPVRLYIRANGVTYTADTSGNARPTQNQAANDDARVYFNVNFSNDVPVEFYAVIDPDNVIAESDETNNRFPASGWLTMNFRRRDNLKIVGQRTRYHPSGYTGTQYAEGWAVNGGAADWFEQLLPIRNNGIQYSVKSGYLDWTTSLAGGDGQHALIQTLNWMWITENLFSWFFGSGAFTGAEHVYGWVDHQGYSGGHADMPVYPHAGGLGVVGIGTDGVSASNPGSSSDNPGRGALIFGHELIHDYDVFHTNTGGDDCGSNDSNSNFPYSTSSIQEFGFNPVTGKIYNPASTHDVMSYCPSGGSKEGWLSPFTWNRMFNELATSSYSAVRPREVIDEQFYPTGSERSVAVRVTVDNPDLEGGENSIGHLYLVDTGVAYSLPDGDYEVQLRNAEGTILARESFTATFESEYDPPNEEGDGGIPGDRHGGEGGDEPPFDPSPTLEAQVSFIMPWVEGTTSIVLVRGDEVLAERVVSSSGPVITITAPGPEPVTWEDGDVETLEWTASDPDGDPLVYSIFYSHDAGATWDLLQSDWISTTYELQVDSLAGGSDVRFRVVASDGVNTAYDETDGSISVPNKAPLAVVLNPVNGQTVRPGHLVVLMGMATDMEDGALPDGALRWSSDREGSLGIGPSIALNHLQPGRHFITLTVSDSHGAVTNETIELNIAHRLILPNVSR